MQPSRTAKATLSPMNLKVLAELKARMNGATSVESMWDMADLHHARRLLKAGLISVSGRQVAITPEGHAALPQ